MRQVDSLLARFPSPVTLAPRRLKSLIGLALMLGLTGFSVFLLQRAIEAGSSEMLWAGLSLVVCGALAGRCAILLLWPGTIGLTLNIDGFEIGGLFRRQRWRWRDVSGFRVEKNKDDFEVIMFEVAASRSAKNSGWFGNHYPLSNDDLAWLMDEWRARALQHAPHSPVPLVARRA